MLPLLLPLLSRLRSFAAAHWRALAFGLGCAIASAAITDGCHKPQLVTKTEVQTVYKDRIVEHRVEVAAKETQAAETKTIVRDRIVTVHGACEEHTVVTVGRQEQTASQSQTAQHVEIQRVATEQVKTAQTVAQPQLWHGGALLGVSADLPGLLAAPPQAVLGGHVEHAIPGTSLFGIPVMGGAFGTYSLGTNTLTLGLSAGF